MLFPIRNLQGNYLEAYGDEVIIKANPLIGFGFSNYLVYFPYVRGKDFNYYDEKFLHAHNDYLETILFELGWIGVVIFLWLLSIISIRFYKMRHNKEAILYASCLMVYLINAMGNFLSHLAISGMYLILFWGLFEAVRRETNGKITPAG